MAPFFAPITLFAFSCAALACIGDERRAGDDTSVPDTMSDLEDGLDRFDTRETTSADSSPDTPAPDTDGATCQSASECVGALPACQRWSCEGTCKAVFAPDDEPCEDESVCTATGRCRDGVCQPGATLTCDDAPVCHRPVCDPVEGCGSELVLGGFCSVAEGVAWGSCDGTRMAPLDTCAADGCRDAATASATPLPKELVVGDWFSVLQVATGTTPFGIAGTGRFTDGGEFIGSVKNELSELPISLLGTWCLDAGLGAAFSAGPIQVVGQVSPDGNRFGGSGNGGEDVLVAVRPRGAVADVHGADGALITRLDEQDRLLTFAGTLTFERGCIAEDAAFQSDFEFLEVLAGTCVPPPDSQGLVAFGVMVAVGQTNVPLALRGAIGEDGDVLVLSREKGDRTLAFGMLLAVRLASGASSQIDRAARWVFAMQERKADMDTHLGFTGALITEDGRVVNGLVGDEPLLGERILVDPLGRFVLDVRSPSSRRLFTGYLTPKRDFGFFYEVARPDDGVETVEDVSETPSGASFGVIVRRGE